MTMYIMQYPGSKTKIAERIIAVMRPHKTFVEVFGGTAALTMAKPPSEVEVYNDINGDLVNLFRVIRNSESRIVLQQVLDLTPFARDEYNDIRSKWKRKEWKDEIEHARLVFCLYNMSVQGLATRPYYKMATFANPAETMRTKVEALAEIGARMSSVQIENHHFMEILNQYDSPDTLFYLDPPYVSDTRAADLYSNEMYLHEHKGMVNWLLGSLRGAAILSGYDHPLYAPLDKAGWHRISIETRMTMQVSGTRESHNRTEVLWLSYPPPEEIAVAAKINAERKTRYISRQLAMFGIDLAEEVRHE